MLLSLSIAGALGVLARFALIGILVPPIGTLAVNTLGSFLIGMVVSMKEVHPIVSHNAVVISVGFLGGFTTLSAFSIDTHVLFQAGRTGAAIAYFFLTPCLGVGAAFLGVALGRGL